MLGIVSDLAQDIGGLKRGGCEVTPRACGTNLRAARTTEVADAVDVGRTQDGAAKPPWKSEEAEARPRRWRQAGVRLAKGPTGIERATRDPGYTVLGHGRGLEPVSGVFVVVDSGALTRAIPELSGPAPQARGNGVRGLRARRGPSR